MKVREIFKQSGPIFSFEFFLPKSEGGLAGFKETVRGLKRLSPSFVTLTYGAGGTGRERTIETAGMIQNEIGLTTVAHLTCIAHTRGEIEDLLKKIRGYGIENIMALRGDPPKDDSQITGRVRHYRNATDLVRHIREFGGFCIGVAGYPEKHPEARSWDDDLRHLKEKVAVGADFITTQLFFENRSYDTFVEQVRTLGITIPIIPGLMPVTNYGQLRKFAALCGARIPEKMIRDLEPRQDDTDFVHQYGIEWTYRQACDLLDHGAPGIHFYTLNRPRATEEILSRLLERPEQKILRNFPKDK
ncbi:MAG TPA: methylenetetrahydrofolate reductase [NAD(P)H] [Nitrospiria bacterium]